MASELPPLVQQYPKQFLPEPVQNYSWRPSGTYTDPRTRKTWFLPNHRNFTDWVNQEFIKYFSKAEGEGGDESQMSRLSHLFSYQRFISEFFCPASPYRGILVNHEMGSGKSCTGITAGEKFRQAGYKMVVLLPAGLRDNMIGEIRKWGQPDLSYPAGFKDMDPLAQARITNELNRRIRSVYHFVSYNSSRVVQDLMKLGLDNACILIDEIHDLVNMMASETGRVGKRIYNILMGANNLRVIGLTGTVSPINYPFELGILFNIIRGPIPVWDTVKEQSQRIIGWSRAFPERREDFDDLFVDYETKTLRNVDMIKRRAIGLVSYFHGARKGLYPDVIHMEIERVEMHDIQFDGYWKSRTEEIVRESRSGSGKRIAPNTFRPNSRQYCNYALPPGLNRPMSLGKYKRLIFDSPTLNPFEKLWTETQKEELRDLFARKCGFHPLADDVEPSAVAKLDQENRRFRSKWASYVDGKARLTFLVELIQSVDMIGKYEHIITSNEEVAILQPGENRNGVENALAELSGPFKKYLDPEQDLEKCSRKHLRMHHNLMTGPGSDGPAFVFSNFRTLEGVEIFSRELLQMGWSRYEPSDADEPKLRYAIVSGAESQELRTRIVEYYNHPRNKNGEYLKLILGTSSAAQGLSLMNCRQVHIMEPWWTLILILQVIGRARRIRSHHGLPEHLRKVHVFQYHSVLSPSQKSQIAAKSEHQTTDEYLYERALEKDAINQQCYDLVKTIALDFALSACENRPLEHGLSPEPLHHNGDYSYMPRINQESCCLNQIRDAKSERLQNQTYEIVEKTYRYKAIKVGTEKFAVILDKNGRPIRRSVVWTTSTGSIATDQAIPLYDQAAIKFGRTLVLRAYVDSKGKRREPSEGKLKEC